MWVLVIVLYSMKLAFNIVKIWNHLLMPKLINFGHTKFVKVQLGIVRNFIDT